MITDVWKYRGKSTGELRSSVCYAIKTGVFDYAKQFPSSRNLEKFGEARQDLTIKELAEKFLALKETEVAKTSLNTYRAVIKNILSIIGEKNLASSINKEKLLEVRKELLTGYQIDLKWANEARAKQAENLSALEQDITNLEKAAALSIARMITYPR